MNKIKQPLFFAAFLLLSSSVLLGCLEQAMPPAGGGPSPQESRNSTGGGRFGNLTAEQRQQMAAERLQASLSACEGKAVNETCQLQSPRGNATGTCRPGQDGKLACAPEFNGQRGGGFNRSLPPQQPPQ